jgi:hypothetical protein
MDCTLSKTSAGSVTRKAGSRSITRRNTKKLDPNPVKRLLKYFIIFPSYYFYYDILFQPVKTVWTSYPFNSKERLFLY